MVRLLKYALVPFFMMGGLALHNNYCSLEAIEKELEFTNDELYCQMFWSQPKFMVWTSVVLFVCLLLVDATLVIRQIKRNKALS